MNSSQNLLNRDCCLVGGPGWRLFKCEDCEHLWKEATRNSAAPNGENCPRCGEWVFPYHSEPDSTLKTDARGNLVFPPEPKRTTRHLR